MNRYTRILTIMAVTLGIAFATTVFLSEASETNAVPPVPPVPPESVTIDKIKDKKSPVTFPHAKHATVLEGKCGDCHAKAEGGGALKPEFLAKPADMAAALKHPFHTQCKGCHTSGGKGPTACADCHK